MITYISTIPELEPFVRNFKKRFRKSKKKLTLLRYRQSPMEKLGVTCFLVCWRSKSWFVECTEKKVRPRKPAWWQAGEACGSSLLVAIARGGDQEAKTKRGEIIGLDVGYKGLLTVVLPFKQRVVRNMKSRKGEYELVYVHIADDASADCTSGQGDIHPAYNRVACRTTVHIQANVDLEALQSRLSVDLPGI